MKSTHKQTALKASLFMILAANVSWQTSKSMNLVTNVKLNSADLASTTSELTRAARGAGPADTSTVVTKIDPAPLADAVRGAKPDAAITTLSTGQELTERHTFCGVDFMIHFSQKTEAGVSKVTADIRYVSDSRYLKGVVIAGTFANRVSDADGKADFLSQISPIAEAAAKKNGAACDDDKVVVNPQPTAPDTRTGGDDDKITRGQRNCSLDKNGEPMKDHWDKNGEFHGQRFECNLARLEKIDLEQSEEEDIPDTDENGRRVRTPRRRHEDRTSIDQVQSILMPLENTIRAMLTSDKDDRREEGEYRLQDLIDSLETVKETATDSKDERQMTQIINSLQKAYPLGEKVDRLADNTQKTMSDISDKMQDLQVQMTTGNYYQQMAARQQLQVLSYQQQQVQNSLSQNQDFLKLRAYQQAGLLSQSDYTDFAGDYLALIQSGQTANGLATAPSDISTGRANLIDRSTGFALPTYPTLNYQQLGLNNPSLAGGQNPMIPSTNGYPQTSGYPTTNGIPQSNLPMTLPMNVPISGQQGSFMPTQYNTYSNPYVNSQNPYYSQSTSMMMARPRI